MTAKTAPAPANQHGYGADPVTPVVIKTGGDGDPTKPGAPPLRKVTITSDTIPFVETVPGRTWASSQSTLTGRITKLIVKDGSRKPHHEVHPGLDLASVTVRFGASEVMAMESGDAVAAADRILLVITSPENPFSVLEDGNWTNATSHFPDRMTRVILRVGDREEFSHQCQTEDVKVEIYFK